MHAYSPLPVHKSKVNRLGEPLQFANLHYWLSNYSEGGTHTAAFLSDLGRLSLRRWIEGDNSFYLTVLIKDRLALSLSDDEFEVPRN